MRWTPLLLLGLAHCGGDANPPAPPEPLPPPSVSAPFLSAGDAWAAADARNPVPLLSALSAPDPEGRARATLALARLHDPAQRAALLVRLRDPFPDVRRAAGLGLAGLGPDPEVETALLGALVAESDPALRADLLADLGRAGSLAILPSLEGSLDAEHPEERAAACTAATQLALASAPLPAAFLLRVAREAASAIDPSVALACAHALVRAPPTEGLTAALAAGLRSPDPEVRGMTVRALGRCPDLHLSDLEPVLADPDPDVLLLSVRALSAHPLLAGGDDATLRLLRALLARALADPEAPRITQALLGALEAVPASLARGRDALEAIEAARAEARARLAGARTFSAVDCGFARLVDLGRGWPGRVETCGAEASDPAGAASVAAERSRLAAELLGVLEGAEPARAGYLQRLADDPAPIVREAAATALGAMDEPIGRALLARLAADPDLGVVVAATNALAQRFARAAAAHEASVLSAVLAGAPPPPSTWPDAAAFAVLRAATERFREAEDLEGLVTALGALRAAREPTLADLATGLAHHPSAAVREAAAAALEPLDLPGPEGPPLPPGNPLAAEALRLAAPVQVEVETELGRFVIELRPDWAPTTVARFLGLVDAGFYDGLSFHRVVPAFVVQGGDPRGDGYGGPGWSQRCEDNRVPYERGTVGMALAGRDTGGSQFFITLTPQPHLNGRYTAFGRVVEGMEVVERVLRGDTMRRVHRR